MALASVDQLKARLRIQTDAMDDDLAALLASATAAIEVWLQRPIEVRETEMEVDTCTPNARVSYMTKVFLPHYPIDDLTGVVDGDGDDVDLNLLRVNARTGVVQMLDGSSFLNPPYTFTADVGLSALPEYQSLIEPVVNQAILDTASDLYHRRNPAAMSEREGGGIAVQYSDQIRGVGADNKREDQLVPRVAALLAPWRRLA